ncbi:acetyl-CoA C-acyltransferase [Fodinisporobacter ferrooxydans]|uniref:acetyl-CoA C-acyltransferase n=1 Tax=Fodinisporobacter ferrooxydans TaxID=2901836 RepID=A0ABY4CKJ3_9BACL|nr:acetyl-CoA C-acyltransferase [Alicyclobacillaceae bacterium MYW30-H2]
MQEAVIAAAVRTPVGKAPKGSLRQVRPDDMAALVVEELLRRVPAVAKEEIEDVIMGCATPEAVQGMNVGRIVALRAGLPTTVPGFTVNRFCSSGLQSIAIAAEKIMCGFADVVIAGGLESMSLLPMGGYNKAPNPTLVDQLPDVYMAMGHTAERVAERFGISREDQDRFAVRSHRLAQRALESGKFDGEIVPVPLPDGSSFRRDEGIRPATTLEVLAGLKPAFRANGSVTAGNSSQTSDGAAGVLLLSKTKAERLGVRPLGTFRSFIVAGVDPDIMGIGPVAAIPKALAKAGIQKEDVDLFEINEAFAAQAVHVVRYLGLDLEKVNVNGGAIAMGHPLGCTGSKLTVSLLYEMERRNARYGVVSMCIGGGMGAAGVFERMVD